MRQEQILIQGLKTAFRIEGEGAPLLILHGWGSKSGKWEKIGELLAKNGYKIIIPDLPGFGKTEQPPKAWGLDEYCDFIEKFIQNLKLEKFYILGHSFGGGLAVKYVLKNPEKVEKLFLVAPAVIRKKTIKKQLLFFESKILKIFSFLPFYNLFRKAFYKFIVKKSDYLNFKGVMKDSYLKIIKQDLSQILEQVKVPTIIIWGEKDDITPLKYSSLINKKIKNSKLEIIKSVSHDLEKIAKPEILVEIIMENIS